MLRVCNPLWSHLHEQEPSMSISLDSPHVHAISAHLHQAFVASGGQPLWLAIDGSESPLHDIDGIDWHQRPSVTVRLQHPEIATHWHPRWFALQLDRALDAHILNHSIVWALEEASPQNLRAGQGRRIAGWFIAAEPMAKAAATHWANLMVRRVPYAIGWQLLRLHDPAVLWAVWQTLPREQHAQWLGPLQQWHLLDPVGELIQLTELASGRDTAPRALLPELSAQQWQDIQNIGPLHQAMHQLDASPHLDADAFKQRFQTGLHALRRAKQLRLNDLHSLSLFAQLAMSRHPLFDQHPELQQLLQQRASDEPLGGLLSDLTEQDWQRLCGEISVHHASLGH